VVEPLQNASRPALRELLVFWLLALAAVAWIAPHGPLYWDSFGYVAQAATGQVGGLALGRPLFVLVSHGFAQLARALGAELSSLEPLLRVLWAGVSALSAPLVVTLAHSLRLPRDAGRWAGLFVALSPAMAHASGQVLTDGPSVTALLASTVCASRAKDGDGGREALWWLGAGASLGAAFALRETSIAHALVLYGLISLGPKGSRGRAVVTASTGLILTAGLCLAWAARQPGWGESVVQWARAMQRERVEHAYGVRDFGAYLGWLVTLGPVAFAAALMGWIRARRVVLASGRAFAVVALGSLAQLLALGAYQDIAFSPRYLLGAMPGAVALVAAVTLAPWARSGPQARAKTLATVGLTAAIALGAGALLRERERPLRDAIDTVEPRLRAVGPDAVIVTGQVCPAVQLAQRLSRVSSSASGSTTALTWTAVCPGWGWPADLSRALDQHRAQGRTVVIDLREGVWVGPRQLAAKGQARAWAERARGQRGVRVWE
jgi:4-amino-4-deoxy-L-arabinose transferase-like glycosyltransferase